jgi:hypothetical protein
MTLTLTSLGFAPNETSHQVTSNEMVFSKMVALLLEEILPIFPPIPKDTFPSLVNLLIQMAPQVIIYPNNRALKIALTSSTPMMTNPLFFTVYMQNIPQQTMSPTG